MSSRIQVYPAFRAGEAWQSTANPSVRQAGMLYELTDGTRM